MQNDSSGDKASENSSEIPGKFLNVLLEKDSRVDRVKIDEVLHRTEQERYILHTMQRRAAGRAQSV